MINYAIKAGAGFQYRLPSLHLTLIQKVVLFVVTTALLVVITAALLPLLDDIGIWGHLAPFVANELNSATVGPVPGLRLLS